MKIRGFRIELGEIESVMCKHPAVREVTVMARGDTADNKRLVAYLVASAPVPAVSELRDLLRKKLPDYMVPSAFVFLDKLPLTSSGKIDLKALPEPEQERPELVTQFVMPRTAVEAKLAEIWSQVLRLERVGIHDNFFELGGDSILSIQVIALSRQNGITLSPKLLFQNQTIAELAAVATVASELPKAEQILVQGSAPLTPIQHWFFEQELADPHYYNQSFLFTVNESLDMDALERALAHLERHHDALRLRFATNVNPRQQTFALPSPSAPFERLNLSTVADYELSGAIEAAAAHAQTTLDYTQGPMWRAIYFDSDRNVQRASSGNRYSRPWVGGRGGSLGGFRMLLPARTGRRAGQTATEDDLCKGVGRTVDGVCAPQRDPRRRSALARNGRRRKWLFASRPRGG